MTTCIIIFMSTVVLVWGFDLNNLMGTRVALGRVGKVARNSPPLLENRQIRSAMANYPTEIATVDQLEVDFVRNWYLKQYNRRPDVSILDKTCSLPEFISEVWKSVLISVRVMEKDQDLSNYLSLVVFSGLDADVENSATLRLIESAVADISKSQSSLLLQPNFRRALKCRVLPPSDRTAKPILILEVDTKREFAPTPDFSDIDDFTPKTEDALNNDIEEFPFPTVYDFISEINRPPDPATMAELEFNYKIYDFKYDLAAMAKKKNPQDVVNNINCKLTRLAKWKRVLEAAGMEEVDAFSDTLGWSEKVKLKYQSLKAIAALDTKKALDTQYDKRAVFLNIIDQWSDRLKRSFKFTYFQSSRDPENFNDAILNTQWRKDFSKTMTLLSRAPFMDFEGPDFEPGNVQPLFADDRVVLWDANYPVEQVLAEMIGWQRFTDKAKAIAGLPLIGDVSQHTYSRGLITERVFADTFAGLSMWLARDKTVVSHSTPEDVSHDPSVALDHHDSFKSGIEGINKLSRARSVRELKAVKDMFRDDFTIGKDIVEWWTDIVRNFDKASEMETVAKSRTEPWSDIIEEIVTDPTAAEATASVSVKEAKELAEEHVKRWRTEYKKVTQSAEEIESNLEWVNKFNNEDINKFCATLKKEGVLRGETITVNFDTTNDTFIFVAPRFFRGVGMDEELSAFMEYFRSVRNMLSSDVFRELAGLGSDKIDIIAFHPHMVDEAGVPAFDRRAPHPALFFQRICGEA